MDQSENRRVALVTGSGRGIGRAIAVRLARDGFNVVINDLHETDDSQATVAAVEEAGAASHFVAADVSDVAAAANLISSSLEKFQRLDLLVNNAGIERQAAFWDVTEADYDAVLNVNLKGAFFTAQAFVRHLRQVQRPGSIVNISSVHEDLPFPNYSPYTLSKGGMQMLNRTLAVELGPLGIRINNVAPGAIRTEISADMYADPKRVAALKKGISLGSVGTVDDVAGVVSFLASDDARYVTGATYFVDGGLTWHYVE